LLNAAILVLAAMVFYDKLAFDDETDWIRVGYHTLALEPFLGTVAASILFAIALLASGQSSTITGTLAGQVVMEGFMHWRIRPWARRLITRLVAIVPAIVIIGWRGENTSVTGLLVLSQVVLAMQLPFAMFPLLHFTSSEKYMGRFGNGWFLRVAGWVSAALITALALYGLPETMERAWAVIVGGS
jgi:manganese transport protein